MNGPLGFLVVGMLLLIAERTSVPRSAVLSLSLFVLCLMFWEWATK